MSGKLFVSAISKFALGVILVGALIFWPAGTLAFWRGWLLMGILFIPMLAAGFVMMAKSPQLLERRLDAKEKIGTQSVIVKLAGLMFILSFVLAGLGHRLGWYTLPYGVSIAGAVLFLLAYVLYAEVLRENVYLSRTIEVQENQTVVDTGLYGIVRHPMYSATLLLFLSMPLVLGSLYALLPMLAYPALIIGRLLNEEKLLEEELPGYREYKGRVKYRLIPFIW